MSRDNAESTSRAAVAASKKAYTLAWCDGPPYAYHHGLSNARKGLQELGESAPRLAIFDESKFDPMPDVELDFKSESVPAMGTVKKSGD